MANPPWTNEERSHHNAYSGNLRTPMERSLMRPDMGTAVNWSTEETNTLLQGLDTYSLEPPLSCYVKIAFKLQDKNVRDVAKRSQWIRSKKRKEDDNGLGIARADNKEIIDMVVASQVYAPSHQHGINQLLKQNEQWFSQISENLTSLRPMDNLELFINIRNNFSNLFHKLNEKVSETMKHMPPLPDQLDDELFYAIFPHLSLL